MLQTDRPIRFVYFDLDDTLVDTTGAVLAAYAAGEELLAAELTRAGFAAPDGDVREELVANFGSRLPREYFTAWLAEAGAANGVAADLILRATAVYFQRLKHLVPYPEARPTLEFLQERGLGAGVITDGIAAEQRAKLAAAGLERLVGPIFISEDYPLFQSKPGQMMFEDALAAVGCAAAEVMFVGDRPKDVLGANIAGMVPVRILQGWVNRRPGRERLRLARPRYTIQNLEELPPLVLKHGAATP
jgi:putative hydrolase of the HAD superfamily